MHESHVIFSWSLTISIDSSCYHQSLFLIALTAHSLISTLDECSKRYLSSRLSCSSGLLSPSLLSFQPSTSEWTRMNCKVPTSPLGYGKLDCYPHRFSGFLCCTPRPGAVYLDSIHQPISVRRIHLSGLRRDSFSVAHRGHSQRFELAGCDVFWCRELETGWDPDSDRGGRQTADSA